MSLYAFHNPDDRLYTLRHGVRVQQALRVTYSMIMAALVSLRATLPRTNSQSPENRPKTQKEVSSSNHRFQGSGRLRAIPKFEIFAPKHYGWIGGRMTPVLKEGCDVGHSQRDVFREAGEKNEERGMGPFLIKHVVLNIEYTNTYYIYTYLPIFIVHDSYIQFAECPSILQAGTLHHLRSLAQDYS